MNLFNSLTLSKLNEVRERLEEECIPCLAGDDLEERRRGKPGTTKGIVHQTMSLSRAKDALEKMGLYLKTGGGPGGKGIVATVRGNTYPVKDILKKYGFQFKNFKPEPYWYNPKGLKLNYASLYHDMASAMHKQK